MKYIKIREDISISKPFYEYIHYKMNEYFELKGIPCKRVQPESIKYYRSNDYDRPGMYESIEFALVSNERFRMLFDHFGDRKFIDLNL